MLKAKTPKSNLIFVMKKTNIKKKEKMREKMLISVNHLVEA